MSWRVLNADCVEAMAEMDEASVDAIVTDPPYGIGFMNKGWDSLEGPEGWGYWATEALRVLKPGGHLLAFGGTRTYHRLACAVEDAGFEIRDSLLWLYGSGFPKSLAVDKAIDRARNEDAEPIRAVTAFITAYRNGKTNGDIDAHFGFNGMAGHWTTQGAQAAVPTVPQWAALKSLLSLPDDMDAEVWRLNGRKGQPGKNWEKREKLGERDVPIGHAFAGPTYGGDSSNQRVDETAPATPEAQRWQGWGTALKPAHEPIVVARKPLVGTVAANVQAHGTGALNVDGCRIKHDGEGVWGDHGQNPENHLTEPGSEGVTMGVGWHSPGSTRHDAGRWPANVALTHLPECEAVGERRVKASNAPPNEEESSTNTYGWSKGGIYKSGARHGDEDGLETVTAWRCVEGCPVAELDRQSGERPGMSGGGEHRAEYEGGMFGAIDAPHLARGDTGGASRFFYTAKASRAERSVGLINNGSASGDGKIAVCRCPKPQADTQPRRDTDAGIVAAECDSSTTGSGSKPTAPSPTASKSTTSTATRKTTGSTTSPSSRRPSTSESTPLTSGEQATGGSGAAPSAANGSSPTPTTSTSTSRAGSSTDVADPATSPESSRTSSSVGSGRTCPDCGGVVEGALRNSHPT